MNYSRWPGTMTLCSLMQRWGQSYHIEPRNMLMFRVPFGDWFGSWCCPTPVPDSYRAQRIMSILKPRASDFGLLVADCAHCVVMETIQANRDGDEDGVSVYPFEHSLLDVNTRSRFALMLLRFTKDAGDTEA